VRQVDVYELMIRREAEALAAEGYDVEVLCMQADDRPRHVEVNGVKVTSLRCSRRKGSKLRYVFEYAQFFGLAASTLTLRHLRRPYSVVQVNTMPDALVLAAALPKVLGAKVVAYMHEPSPELGETVFGPGILVRALGAVEQLVLRFADHAITVTDELKQRYVERGARAERITVVLNGVDPSNMQEGWSAPDHPPGEEFTVMCHGSIEDRYGQDTLIDAAALLRTEMPDLRVVITGRGAAVDSMLERVARLGLEDIVRFEGWVPMAKLNDLLYTADVGVVAQKASPYSHLVHTNKMVDYWMFGLPVVASRLDAVSHLYGDDVIEYFEAGNPRSLAAALARVRSDRARREQLRRAGARALERNGWPAQRRAYLDVFRRLTG
jgi:glycosyltransferase involved in cell wall biosynthesis